MNSLTIARPLLLSLLRQARHLAGPLRVPVGVSVWDSHLELFARPGPVEGEDYVLFGVSDDFTPPAHLQPNCRGWLSVGRRVRRGEGAGEVRNRQGCEPLERLNLVGPGMHQLPLTTTSPPVGTWRGGQRWSRTRGALGPDVWRRLTMLRYGVIGAGRTGSAVADLLVSGLGVDQLLLLDPDRLEEHNLGEMVGVGASQEGQFKTEALAAALTKRMDGMAEVQALACSITHGRAVRAVQECDVLFSCLDHDGARLATAALAVLFARPLLDIGAGVHGRGRRREIGVDIRLIVPGEGRCLMCLGGLAEPSGARQSLRSAADEEAAHAGRDWRRERSGSLRSVAQLGAALAVRLWEDFVAERVRSSRWLHVEYDAGGQPRVTQSLSPLENACRLCPLLSGGEGGLPQAAAFIRGEAFV